MIVDPIFGTTSGTGLRLKAIDGSADARATLYAKADDGRNRSYDE
jgi:hypothetical protein